MFAQLQALWNNLEIGSFHHFSYIQSVDQILGITRIIFQCQQI